MKINRIIGLLEDIAAALRGIHEEMVRMREGGEHYRNEAAQKSTQHISDTLNLVKGLMGGK